MAYVKLSQLPDPKTEYSTTLTNLYGGLNIHDLDYMLDSKESPEMKNLQWEGGMLCSRPGQLWNCYTGSGTSKVPVEFGTTHAAYERGWHDHIFAHLGNKLYCFKIDYENAYSSLDYTLLYTGGADFIVNGTFIPYNEYLLYKTTGYYIRIAYNGESNVTIAAPLGSSLTATIDADTWREKVSADGNYTLTYNDNNRWTTVVGEDTIYLYPLSSYGITVTGAPTSGDTLIVSAQRFVAEGLGSGAFTCYTPVTYINAAPSTGAGDVYQPENRLNSNKTIWYNADYTVTITPGTGLSAYIEPSAWKDKVLADGTYTLTYDGAQWSYTVGSVTTTLSSLVEYGISITSGTPASGSTLTVNSYCANEYYLPVKGKELVKVVVDGTTLTQDEYTKEVSFTHAQEVGFNPVLWRQHCTDGQLYTLKCQYNAEGTALVWHTSRPIESSDYVVPADVGLTFDTQYQTADDTIRINYTPHDYRYDKTNGLVVFASRPQVTVPATNNTVQITYSLENATAYNNIMDCRFVATYGGTGDMAVVMAGSETQPNAYFWCGQTSTAMDCTYFPMEQYQLASDATDPITGFGKQASYLIIFKKYSIGRTSYGTEEVNERTVIDLPYTAINARTGCDLPWTIQLVNDNLVWCNTDMGVHYLASTTAAYENGIQLISEKVNGSSTTDGLCPRVRRADPENVCSLDDGHSYYVCYDGLVWSWNYEISTYKDPSWFYFTDMDAIRFVFERGNKWHFDSSGRLTSLQAEKYDYLPSVGIDKLFRFATQTFSSYDRLKNINSILLNVQAPTNCGLDGEGTKIEYLTDYEKRYDLTPLKYFSFTMIPRDISGSTNPARDLSCSGFHKVFRRRPRCLRVRRFSIRISNNSPHEDLCIISAQIFYTYQGRQR